MKRIAVFCGSSKGFNKIYEKAAISVGNYFIFKNIGLVYGGGKIGLMGVVADTVLHKKGEVIGVIPNLLRSEEVAHKTITKMHITKKMSKRKVKISKLVDGYIALAGGFGTLDELFEAIALIQTQKIGKFPIILVGKSYWGGLMDWVKKTMRDEEHNISEKDIDLFTVVDTAEDAVETIDAFYTKYILTPNF